VQTIQMLIGPIAVICEILVQLCAVASPVLHAVGMHAAHCTKGGLQISAGDWLFWTLKVIVSQVVMKRQMHTLSSCT